MYYIDESGSFTYDELTVSGAHTCSLSIPKGQSEKEVSLYYEPFAELKKGCNILFGSHIRAVEYSEIGLYIEYYDEFFQKISTATENIAPSVKHVFTKIYRRFQPPETALYFKVGIRVQGKTTALTLFYPFAYFERQGGLF
ncbi:MAG: hypothetical protein LBT20_05590 [Clostridiales bacterium]|jgi:hypothetical protein|nr:hypothetical protein [Clostridiales bacterium]